MSSLTSDQVALQLDALPDWQLDGTTICKTFAFASFPDAIGFITRLAFDIAAYEHYPILQNNANLVTATIGNPNDGTMHSRDIQLAKRMEEAFSLFNC